MIRLVARNVRGSSRRMIHTLVLSFGDGSNGALGHTDSFASDAYEPTQVSGLPENVAAVACGHYHSLAVSEEGEVWAWGRNNEGQLGRGDKSIVLSEANFRPQKVKGLESIKVKAVTGSGVASMAISEEGSLWVWGTSKRGQLGLGFAITSALVPQKVQALAGKEVLQVSLGWGHALACTGDGELYSWGYHDSGRLGYLLPVPVQESPNASTTEQDIGEQMLKQQLQKEDAPILQWEPKLVELPHKSRIVQVACGLDHSLALADNGLIYSFGDNSTDQLGREKTKENSVLGIVDGELLNKQVSSIAAGWGHSMAVEKCSGAAYSWGWSSASQLGRPCSGSLPGRIEGIEGKVVSVAAGRVHSIALTSRAQVWSWGCGRNGRLGIASTRDETQPVLLESLEQMSVKQAVCGFDHSLVLVEAVS